MSVCDDIGKIEAWIMNDMPEVFLVATVERATRFPAFDSYDIKLIETWLAEEIHEYLVNLPFERLRRKMWRILKMLYNVGLEPKKKLIKKIREGYYITYVYAVHVPPKTLPVVQRYYYDDRNVYAIRNENYHVPGFNEKIWIPQWPHYPLPNNPYKLLEEAKKVMINE